MTADLSEHVDAESLLRQVEQLDEEVRRLTGDLTEADLHRRPADGGWSIGQVFEHLLIANGLYLARMRPLIARARAHETDRPVATWQPSFVGRFLIRSLGADSTRKVRAPKVFRPGPSPRRHVVAAFLELQRDLAALLSDADGLDWSRLRLSSPVGRLIRINVGDAFVLLVVHARRHMVQVRRIRETVGISGAAAWRPDLLARSPDSPQVRHW
jgi:hypothetical protein